MITFRNFDVKRMTLCRRVGDLFSDKTVSSRLKGMAMKTVKGVENVYTQHTPLLATTLENVARGRLPHMDFPRLGGGDTSPTAAKVLRCLAAPSGSGRRRAALLTDCSESATCNQGCIQCSRTLVLERFDRVVQALSACCSSRMVEAVFLHRKPAL